MLSRFRRRRRHAMMFFADFAITPDCRQPPYFSLMFS